MNNKTKTKMNFKNPIKVGVYAFIAVVLSVFAFLYTTQTEYVCSARTQTMEITTPYFVKDAELWMSVRDNISSYATSGLMNSTTINTKNGQIDIMYDENDQYKFAKSNGIYFFETRYNGYSVQLYNCKKI
ncbi:hypothetical protein [Citrobacter freundii]|uniref:hypothetical protein n=1 Tax=Citrobacter freundii TaxID=546 RepID=UPI0024C1647A|nr:hypothetical protein [Citrobacter freundii]WHW81733.1 hypothetical protein PXV97_16120 [Citrobacter freundii]WHW90823.1 hypothetical protein P0S03_16170 [Citrobacter freundii]